MEILKDKPIVHNLNPINMAHKLNQRVQQLFAYHLQVTGETQSPLTLCIHEVRESDRKLTLLAYPYKKTTPYWYHISEYQLRSLLKGETISVKKTNYTIEEDYIAQINLTKKRSSLT